MAFFYIYPHERRNRNPSKTLRKEDLGAPDNLRHVPKRFEGKGAEVSPGLLYSMHVETDLVDL